MLNVYKASAGSGKTYRLAYEFIKMLLGRRSESGDNYEFYANYNLPHRRILAVTFTNKATSEMKQRIVKQLEVLAHRTSESEYCKMLCEAFNCGETQLKNNAERVLQQLLHDFSYFNISTIDSFFQQVLRSFAREVGLQGGYELEMDTDFVTTTAIEQMFGELDEDTADWLNQYAEETIRNGGNWNIFDGSDITSLAQQLDKEEFKKCREQLAAIDLQTYKAYRESLLAHEETVRNEMADAAKKVIQAIYDEGISPTVFYRGWAKYVYTIASEQYPDAKEHKTPDKKALDSAITNVRKKMQTPDEWFTASKLKKHPVSIEQLTANLLPAFEELISVLDVKYNEYLSVPICLKHIYALGLLSTIDRYIMQYEREHNSILLSKTPDILRGLINKNDAPFIYEKVGTRINHYMIDEFQDTSNLQWENFEPLVSDSLSQANENLIVGDVKQSIYRFRNSEWRLLHEELDRKFDYNQINLERDTNWRSSANVINFNNTFFRRASKLLHNELQVAMSESGIKGLNPMIEEVYKTVEQNVSPKYSGKAGRVAINILSANNEDIYESKMFQRLSDTLRSLLSKGYRARDIAFLVRTAKEGRKIVEFLLDLSGEDKGNLRNIRVVSEESLLISNAPAVKLIVGILRYLQNPSYPINELILAYEYGLMNSPEGDERLPSNVLARYFDNRSKETNIESELVEFIEDISSKPIFEMCEHIIHKFKMHEHTAHVAYVEAFQDLVVEYCQAHSSDLYSFLRWWSEKEKKASVKLPENLDAITVMTIHKSKGLEFPVVIIPYATWTFTKSGNIKWFVPEVEPFNRLPILPITYKLELANSIFAPQFYKELISEYIDNLNLMYVAFTRAEQEFIIYGCENSKNVSRLLKSVLIAPPSPDEPSDAMDFGKYLRTIESEDGESYEYIFEVGADYQPVFEQKPVAQMLDVTYNVVIPSEQRLKQRLTAHNKGGNRMRNYGILMHEILAEITCAEDVRDVVQRYAREGKLKRNDVQDIITKIERLISHPRVSRWFAPDVRVVAESAILKLGEKINRPDRVVIDGDSVTVIDYKFGQIERNDYKEKVAKYMQLVRDMGYSNVVGCIWYVEKDKFVEIE